MNGTPSQKRTRPAPRLQHDNLPQLPKISGDIILQVFTHRSLQHSCGGTLEDNSDNERLAVLGMTVLDAVVTHSLFKQRPPLAMSEIRSRKEILLSDENFEDWVTFYRLRTKVRCHPKEFSSLNTPGETRALFYSYVGGVYAESGMGVVGEWIVDLIDLCSEPPSKKIKSEPMSPPKQMLPIFFASQPPPSPQKEAAAREVPLAISPQVQVPPAMKAPVQLPNPLAPAQPNLPFLPLFNQTASQRRCMVEYPAEFSGPSHAGHWTVRCVVNGIAKGVGTGTSKQVAKEEAARKAYYAMGWT
ncbi:hypothetical protein APHAL10511_006088 [Amanita phalloides]|nr:hypothetical protein APHAL10511_006088 [Amanita phalloides]